MGAKPTATPGKGRLSSGPINNFGNSLSKHSKIVSGILVSLQATNFSLFSQVLLYSGTARQRGNRCSTALTRLIRFMSCVFTRFSNRIFRRFHFSCSVHTPGPASLCSPLAEVSCYVYTPRKEAVHPDRSLRCERVGSAAHNWEISIRSQTQAPVGRC